MKRFFSISIMFLGVLNINAQSHKKEKFYISTQGKNCLFLNLLNVVSVVSDAVIKDSITISLSQGSFSQIDSTTNGLFLVSLDNMKPVTIEAFKIKNAKKHLIAKKIFKVDLTEEQKTLNKLQTKPGIALGKYEGGRIPIDSIRNINCLTINPQYKLLTSDVYFSGIDAVNARKLVSACFYNVLKADWERIRPGITITFDLIEIIELATNKKYKIPEVNFVVVENEN